MTRKLPLLCLALATACAETVAIHTSAAMPTATGVAAR